MRTNPLLLHRSYAGHDDGVFAQSENFADGVISAHGHNQVSSIHVVHHVVREVLDHESGKVGGLVDTSPMQLRHFRPAYQQGLDAGDVGKGVEALQISGEQVVAVFASAGGDQYQRFILESQFAPDLLALVRSAIAAQIAAKLDLGAGRRGKLILGSQVEDFLRADHQDLVVKTPHSLVVSVLLPHLCGRFRAVEDIAEQKHQLGEERTPLQQV